MDIHEHLTNGILDVELRLPGSEPAWTRFDLSGMISQVTLHGKHRLLASRNRLRSIRIE